MPLDHQWDVVVPGATYFSQLLICCHFTTNELEKFFVLLFKTGTAKDTDPPTYFLLGTTVRGVYNFNKTKCPFSLLDLENTSFNIRTESDGEI